MKERILQTLSDLRAYALAQGGDVDIFYHEEDSTLMRFANSAISLNTNEHLIRLEISASKGRKRASYELITDLDKLDEMKRGVDTALEMVKHVQPLTYDPTPAVYIESFGDESSYDPALAALSNEEKLRYFDQAVAGLESAEIKLSGVFSSGVTTLAMISTRSEHTQYFQMTDAQITAVLAHGAKKWELISEQSAQQKADLDAGALHREFTFLLDRFEKDPHQQLPLGSYDIVFGPAATGDMLSFMNWIGFNGGSMKRGFSCIGEEKVGQKVLSEQITLVDDPTLRETFPFRRDYFGIPRKPFPLFERGIFQGFVWFQDDADEFGAKATGHTVHHKSLALRGGTMAVRSVEGLAAMPRERDVLYIPYLHYMNIVNPSKGLITASSRFGALLLKKDGSMVVPFNVRLTQSLLDIFGDRVAWLSDVTVPNNVSGSYGARNPTAIVVPQFMQVNGLEISHANASF
jgi:predicted Zn-dependent protease